jgi:predicted secreted protein
MKGVTTMRYLPRLAIACIATLLLVPSIVVGGSAPSASPASSAAAPVQSGAPVVELAVDCATFEATPAESVSEPVGVGGTLVVRLCSNPSTGYTWSDPVVEDASVLALVSSTSEPAASPLPGAPGTQSFTFHGLTEGTTEVTSSYDQPWAGGKKGAWTLDLEVTVAGATPPPPVTVTIDCESFDGSTAQTAEANVPVGGTLVVSLCSNPSTGYTWSDPVIGDANVVALVSSTSAPAASPLPGAPGTQTFTFRPIAAGSTTLAFSYDQPWKGGKKGAWTLTLNVHAG